MRKIGAEERSAVMLLYPMMANFVVMACILPFVYVPMPVEHLGLIGILASFSFVGGLVMILAYREGEAVIVAPMQYSQILWAAAFGFLIFGETPDWNTAAGAAIIIASGLYIVIREGRGTASGTRPVLGTMNQRADTGTQPRIGLLARLSQKAP
jgi:drug/metabolite transporter (DMT)-like permease